MNKLLSIIVPSYNMEQYLPKCLGSLIVADADLLQKLDVIVVNDGSKDRTSEIAHEFETKYPGVFRVIDKPNGNYGSCINSALAQANGRFVKILDADDTYDTVLFAQYLSKLAGISDDVDMVINDYAQVDELGLTLAMVTYSLPTDLVFHSDMLVKNQCPMAMHAVAYRTEMMRSLDYRQTEGISYTDTEWFYLPPASAKSIRYFPIRVYNYLLGRAGQTMERATWIKNVWMMDKIFERMLKQYDSALFSGCGQRYLEFQLRRMFSIVLDLHFAGSLNSGIEGYIGSIKNLPSKYPFLSDVVKSRVLFVRTPFRFRFCEFILKHPFFAKSVLSFVRWYKHNRVKL